MISSESEANPKSISTGNSSYAWSHVLGFQRTAEFRGVTSDSFYAFPHASFRGRQVVCPKSYHLEEEGEPLRFPPFNLVGRTLKFLLHTGISFTIIVPNLPVKPFWWPVVFSAASDEFVFCRKRDVCAVLYAQKGGGFSPVPSLVKLWVFCVNN